MSKLFHLLTLIVVASILLVACGTPVEVTPVTVEVTRRDQPGQMRTGTVIVMHGKTEHQRRIKPALQAGAERRP